MSDITRRTVSVAALLAACVMAAPAAAQSIAWTPETLTLADGKTLAVESGTLMVPEDRNNPASRKIPLAFIRFRSTSATPGAPIVYLAGGPGGSGIDTFRGPRQPIFLTLTGVADVIALDQRGTGRSNLIPKCGATAPFDRRRTLTEAAWSDYFRQTLTHCIGEWRAAGVAVEGYTTEQSADDLEDLRKALGAPKLNLWGISYGTHLALTTMRRHPGAIERVALSSAEGLDQTVKLPSAVDAAMGRIGARPAAVAVLGETPLPAVMRRVHRRLDASPVTLTVTGPDGKTISFRTDSFPFRAFGSGAAKNPGGIGRLAGMYQALDAGGAQAMAPMVYESFLEDPLSLYGMSVLMDLASGVSNARLKRIAREADESVLGYAVNFPMPQMIGVLPGIDLGSDFRKEIRSDIPTLLFSGELDMRTPLEEQTTATAGLTALTPVLVRGGGHDLFEAHPAIPPMLVDFFSGKAVTTRELTIEPPAK